MEDAPYQSQREAPSKLKSSSALQRHAQKTNSMAKGHAKKQNKKTNAKINRNQKGKNKKNTKTIWLQFTQERLLMLRI